MSRVKSKSPNECQQIGTRFIQFIEKELGWTLPEAALALGYANATTLRSINRGDSLPSPEKILLAAKIFRDKKGRKMDLNWLFTGIQSLDRNTRSNDGIGAGKDDIIILVKALNDEQKKALAILLRPS